MQIGRVIVMPLFTRLVEALGVAAVILKDAKPFIDP